MWLRACEGKEREEWMELRTADFRIKGTETSICLANWDCAAAMFDLTADSTSPPPPQLLHLAVMEGKETGFPQRLQD